MIDVWPPRLRFVPHAGARVAVDADDVGGGIPLRADDAQAGPSRISFDDGRGIASVIRGDPGYALRVNHADAPRRMAFARIDHRPGGRDWIVDACFVPQRPACNMPIENVVGTIQPTPNPGAVLFSRAGSPTVRSA